MGAVNVMHMAAVELDLRAARERIEELERERERAEGWASAYLKAGQEIAHTAEGLLVERDRLSDAILRAQKERDRWVRLFDRLEKAVARHLEAKGWMDDADEALRCAWERVLKAAATPEGGSDAG